MAADTFIPVWFDRRCHYASCGSEGVGLRLCGGCRVTRYCSKTCQRQHWPEHALVCASYRAQGTSARHVIPEVGPLIVREPFAEETMGLLAAKPKAHVLEDGGGPWRFARFSKPCLLAYFNEAGVRLLSRAAWSTWLEEHADAMCRLRNLFYDPEFRGLVAGGLVTSRESSTTSFSLRPIAEHLTETQLRRLVVTASIHGLGSFLVILPSSEERRQERRGERTPELRLEHVHILDPPERWRAIASASIGSFIVAPFVPE